MLVTMDANVIEAAEVYWNKGVATLRITLQEPVSPVQRDGETKAIDLIDKAERLFAEMIEAVTQHRHTYARWQVDMTYLYIQRMLGTIEAANNVARCQSIPLNHRKIAVNEIMDDAVENVRFNLVF